MYLSSLTLFFRYPLLILISLLQVRNSRLFVFISERDPDPVIFRQDYPDSGQGINLSRPSLSGKTKNH